MSRSVLDRSADGQGESEEGNDSTEHTGNSRLIKKHTDLNISIKHATSVKVSVFSTKVSVVSVLRLVPTFFTLSLSFGAFMHL